MKRQYSYWQEIARPDKKVSAFWFYLVFISTVVGIIIANIWISL